MDYACINSANVDCVASVSSALKINSVGQLLSTSKEKTVEELSSILAHRSTNKTESLSSYILSLWPSFRSQVRALIA